MNTCKIILIFFSAQGNLIYDLFWNRRVSYIVFPKDHLFTSRQNPQEITAKNQN